jgi:hypothetical protein
MRASLESRDKRMKIAVAVATTGRAHVLHQTVPAMLAQTRLADRVIIAAVVNEDVAGIQDVAPSVEVVLARRGLPAQRNAALLAAHNCDAVLFFDDDFVPSREFIARTEQLFLAHPGIVGITGNLAADGVHTGGCSFDAARRLVAQADADLPPIDSPFHDINHLYGCNMAVRLPAAATVGFDERLPLYAWQEDRDFSRRLNGHGRIVRTPALVGVHLGVTQARSSGLRLGYSQVANPLYLLGKGTMRPIETTLFIARNVVANLVRSLKPEPWIDRTGRLRGNLMALNEAARGRAAPERILDL